MRDLLEAPQLERTDTNKDGEIFHYVRKSDIAESAVFGTQKRALCGIVFVVTLTPPPNPKICPDCKQIRDSLPG